MRPTEAGSAPSPVAVPSSPGTSPTSQAPRGRERLQWLGLTLLIVLQLVLFTRYVGTHVSPFYPVNHDQLPVLEWAYRGALVARAHPSELPAALVSPESMPRAQFFKGALLPLLAMVSSSIFGINRLSATLVNFTALAVGECAIYWYLRRRGGVPCGVLGVGLFLLAGTHYYWAGGLNDLRRDYLGVLAMGVAFMAVAGHLARGGAGIAAPTLALILVAVSRAVSLVYWALTLGAVCLLLALGRGLGRTPTWAAARLRPCLKLLAVTGVITCVQFTVDLHRFWHYYVAFKLTGAAGPRFREFGADDLRQALLYYPASLFEHSRSTLLTALVLGLALVPLGFVERRWWRPAGAASQTPPWSNRLLAGHVGLFAVLAVCSMAILTWYQPSPLPMGGLIIPLVVCASLALRALSLKVAGGALLTVGVVALALGLGRFATEMTAPSYPPRRDGTNSTTVRGVQRALYDHIDRVVGAGEGQGHVAPSITWLLVHDGLNKHVFNILGMERGVPPLDTVRHNQLPIDDVPLEELLAAVEISDVVVAPISMDALRRHGFEYAGNASIRRSLDRLEDEVPKRFDLVAAGRVLNPAAMVGLWVRKPEERPMAQTRRHPDALPEWLKGRVRFVE